MAHAPAARSLHAPQGLVPHPLHQGRKKVLVSQSGKTRGRFRYDNLLSSIGAGHRFVLSPKYPVNHRLDVAQGKNGHTWSMGAGEAF